MANPVPIGVQGGVGGQVVNRAGVTADAVTSYTQQKYPILSRYHGGQHPLAKEKSLGKLEPLPETRAAFVKALTREMTANGQGTLDPHTVKKYQDKMVLEGLGENVDLMYAREFQRWLRGVSVFNEPSLTPWGHRNMFHVPGVVEYLRELIQLRFDYQQSLMHLYMQVPQSLLDLELYYKYIVLQFGLVIARGDGTVGPAGAMPDGNDPRSFMSISGMLYFLDDYQLTSFRARDLPLTDQAIVDAGDQDPNTQAQGLAPDRGTLGVVARGEGPDAPAPNGVPVANASTAPAPVPANNDAAIAAQLQRHVDALSAQHAQLVKDMDEAKTAHAQSMQAMAAQHQAELDKVRQAQQALVQTQTTPEELQEIARQTNETIKALEASLAAAQLAQTREMEQKDAEFARKLRATRADIDKYRLANEDNMKRLGEEAQKTKALEKQRKVLADRLKAAQQRARLAEESARLATATQVDAAVQQATAQFNARLAAAEAAGTKTQEDLAAQTALAEQLKEQLRYYAEEAAKYQAESNAGKDARTQLELVVQSLNTQIGKLSSAGLANTEQEYPSGVEASQEPLALTLPEYDDGAVNQLQIAASAAHEHQLAVQAQVEYAAAAALAVNAVQPPPTGYTLDELEFLNASAHANQVMTGLDAGQTADYIRSYAAQFAMETVAKAMQWRHDAGHGLPVTAEHRNYANDAFAAMYNVPMTGWSAEERARYDEYIRQIFAQTLRALYNLPAEIDPTDNLKGIMATATSSQEVHREFARSLVVAAISNYGQMRLGATNLEQLFQSLSDHAIAIQDDYVAQMQTAIDRQYLSAGSALASDVNKNNTLALEDVPLRSSVHQQQMQAVAAQRVQHWSNPERMDQLRNQLVRASPFMHLHQSNAVALDETDDYAPAAQAIVQFVNQQVVQKQADPVVVIGAATAYMDDQMNRLADAVYATVTELDATSRRLTGQEMQLFKAYTIAATSRQALNFLRRDIVDEYAQIAQTHNDDAYFQYEAIEFDAMGDVHRGITREMESIDAQLSRLGYHVVRSKLGRGLEAGATPAQRRAAAQLAASAQYDPARANALVLQLTSQAGTDENRLSGVHTIQEGLDAATREREQLLQLAVLPATSTAIAARTAANLTAHQGIAETAGELALVVATGLTPNSIDDVSEEDANLLDLAIYTSPAGSNEERAMAYAEANDYRKLALRQVRDATAQLNSGAGSAAENEAALAALYAVLRTMSDRTLIYRVVQNYIAIHENRAPAFGTRSSAPRLLAPLNTDRDTEADRRMVVSRR